MKLDSIRREYKIAQLTENNIDKNPLNQFDFWMKDAFKAEVNETTAMSLSTIGNDGYPQNRIVLLKDYGEDGFIFFTNYNSEKGKSISEHKKVSLHFYWPELERQIRISGTAQKISPEISDRIFCFASGIKPAFCHSFKPK